MIICVNSSNINFNPFIFDTKEFYGASATVLEQAAICFIPKSDFFTILNRNPAFFQKLMKAVCKELGVMEEKMAQLAQKSVRERLAATIIMLKETYGMALFTEACHK